MICGVFDCSKPAPGTDENFRTVEKRLSGSFVFAVLRRNPRPGTFCGRSGPGVSGRLFQRCGLFGLYDGADRTEPPLAAKVPFRACGTAVADGDTHVVAAVGSVSRSFRPFLSSAGCFVAGGRSACLPQMSPPCVRLRQTFRSLPVRVARYGMTRGKTNPMRV